MNTVPSPPHAHAAPTAPGLKAWEKVLIALACLLFLLSFYLYFADFPLRRYLFDLDDDGKRTSVGTLVEKKGVLRRQREGESEFKALAQAETLYSDDVIVTGSEGGATINLEDGNVLEVGADTMVRLHFQTQFTLGGISRAATVEVVAGTVTSRASPTARPLAILRPVRPVELPRLVFAPKPVVTVLPNPPPTPWVDPTLTQGVRLVSPLAGTRLTLPPRSKRLELPVAFSWTAAPAARPVQITLWKLASSVPGAERTQIFRQVVAADQAGQGQSTSTLKMPGMYEWELRTANGELIGDGQGTTAQFMLEPEFDAIEPIDPLIGGKVMSSTRLSGSLMSNFDITLRWKPYPGATRYQVLVKARNDAKGPTLEREVTEPSFLFSRGKVFAGQFFYQIKAPLSKGFVARSTTQPFVFTFLAPVPVVPRDKSIITAQNLARENDSVLMTWQKTNFTDWYEVQVSSDAQFKSPLKQLRQSENFFVFKSPPVGRFYWRVRSSSKNLISPFSAPYEFKIER